MMMGFIEEYGGKSQTVIVETDKWSVVRVLENDVCEQDGSQDIIDQWTKRQKHTNVNVERSLQSSY